jgi:hypothetical protein
LHPIGRVLDRAPKFRRSAGPPGSRNGPGDFLRRARSHGVPVIAHGVLRRRALRDTRRRKGATIHVSFSVLSATCKGLRLE